jgi:uncharacterized protein YcfJ
MKRIPLLIFSQACLLFGANVFAAPAAAPDITLPIGTEIAVRTIDRINSKTADLHREYAATLDDPVIVDGVTVVPAQTSAVLRVVEMERSGFKRRASLSLSLIAVIVNGQRIAVNTDKVDSKSGSQAKKTAAGAAIGAGAGAAIGAIAGGGLGAGIGAAAGGAAGTLGAVFSGKAVEIAPETRFTYRLTQPVEMNKQ